MQHLSFRPGTRCFSSIVSLFIALLFIAPATLLPAQTPAQTPATLASGVLQKAPPNPRFLEHLNARAQGQAAKATTQQGHAMGLIPSTIDFSHLKSRPAPAMQPNTALPSSYDLRTYNRVTPVGDQGQCGACWDFATYGSVESALLPAQTRSFSENNLKDLDGFDQAACVPGGDQTGCGTCSGGNWQMSSAYLARWSGPINSSDDPYNPTSINTSPANLTTQKHLQNMYVLPPRASSTDNATLKNAVMTYGGLYTTMYMDESSPYFSSNDFSYYYNVPYNYTNHAVTLVGWDDNYSASNFGIPPPGNGAWLIKNSWGTYFANQGYFWISYYDTSYAVEESVAFADSELATNYDQQYQYDPLGWVGNWGYGTPTSWFANVFTATQNQQLKAVATYVVSSSSSYVVKIYTGVSGSPTSGTLAATTSGTFSMAGYNTVVLPGSVALSAGQAFSVVMELTTPGYNYPVPIEAADDNYSSKATASPGQSYISYDGASWSDTTNSDPTMNVSLHAFASASSSVPTASLSATTLAFGNVAVNTESLYQGVTLTNTGGGPLSIGSVALTGTNKAQYLISSNYCPASLAAGANCTIHLHFWPTATGAASAALTITDNAAGSPHSVTLTGTGIPQTTVSLSTTSLAFGNVTVNTESVYQGFTLTNTGASAVTFSSVALTGTNKTQFLISGNTCLGSLAAGANCIVHLHFYPKVTGAATAALTVTDNATGSPQSVSLTGTATAPPTVSLSTATLAFGNVAVNTESVYQGFTVTNTGTSPVTFSSVALTGTNKSQFLISGNTCLWNLAAGANCIVHLHFWPTVTGAASAALTITDNATGSPQSVTLTGTGK
jgi:C1A family cysteine protease